MYQWTSDEHCVFYQLHCNTTRTISLFVVFEEKKKRNRKIFNKVRKKEKFSKLHTLEKSVYVSFSFMLKPMVTLMFTVQYPDS